MTVSGRVEVPAGSLSKEIDRIRREASELDAEKEALLSGKAAPRVHATLSNLIILVSEQAPSVSEEVIEDLLTNLCVSHPSRFFLVKYDEKAEMATAVSSRCVLANSGKHICSEEIFVTVGAEKYSPVPNLLLSLLVPDIQTVVLLLCDPTAEGSTATNPDGFSGLFDGLASMSDVIVYDSSLFTQFAEGYRRVEQVRDLEPKPGFQGTIVRDANWARLRRWQELIVSQFSAQCFVEDARNVQTMRFHQSGDTTRVAAEAILLAGWCAGNRGWNCDSIESRDDTKIVLSCRNASDNPTSIEFVLDKSEGVAALQQVEIEVCTDGGQMVVSVKREADQTAELSTHLSATASGQPDSCDFSVRKVPFARKPLDEIVSHRIGAQATNQHQQRGECEAVKIAELLA